MARGLVACTICLAVGCGIDFPTLDDIVLRPSAEINGTPSYPYEEIQLPVEGERYISLWYVHSVESRALIVIFPGSDANKDLYRQALPLFVDDGYDFILMDYEGFGASSGEASLVNCMADGLAVADYALSRHETVIGFGVSLGTPVLARVAAERAFAGCMFEGTLALLDLAGPWLAENMSPFLSPLGHVADFWIYPQTPPGYDILNHIQNVHESKLFMHSVEDDVTPYASAIRVFEAAVEPKRFWSMRGGHGKMIQLEPDLYQDRVLTFLESCTEQADR